MAKLYVYRNLRTGGFSVRHRGLVVRHVRRHEAAVLLNVRFKVNESGRQRVLREKQKNVHAFVVADRIEVVVSTGPLKQVGYNPYKNKSFMLGSKPILAAERAILKDGRCWIPQ